MSVTENYNLSNKLEEILYDVYKCIVNVKNKSGNLFEIRVYIKHEMEVEFLYLYLEEFNIDENVDNLKAKIDKEIINLFRK